MMTPEERRARGRELCRRLTAEVGRLAAPGLGTWPEAWDIVAEADTDFLVALTAWEADPSEPARLRVRDAYVHLLRRWEEANRQFLEAGRRIP